LVALVYAAKFHEVSEEARKLSGEELVAHINKQGKWQAESNPKFDGLTKEQLKSYLGALKKPATHARRGRPGTPLKPDTVPDSFDSVEAWPQCKDIISLIQDQSACGSCWAVSTTSVMSDRLCIASNGKIQTSLSALDLMACCSFCGYQCQGGYPDEAFYQFTYAGIVTGSNYTVDGLCKPYPIAPCTQDPTTKKAKCPEEPKKDYKCAKSCQSGYKDQTYKNDHYYGSEVLYFNQDNDGAIAELLANGPIVAAFDVYEDFYKYKSGIYEYTGGELLGGHAVRIVGYGVEDGTPFWKVANSWDWYWGEAGYFRIRRGTNECGFEDEITAAIADVSRSLKDK
jgi:cathepsin B